MKKTEFRIQNSGARSQNESREGWIIAKIFSHRGTENTEIEKGTEETKKTKETFNREICEKRENEMFDYEEEDEDEMDFLA
jgi:hypothetical protein